jgi:hypothetical protein
MELITDAKDDRLFHLSAIIDDGYRGRDASLIFNSLAAAIAEKDAALKRERWHIKLEARVYCAKHLPTAKESQIMQPCPWCEVMRVYEERIALRADLAALRARIEDVDGMAKAMNGGLEMHEECGSCEALRRKARAVSSWLKEGK